MPWPLRLKKSESQISLSDTSDSDFSDVEAIELQKKSQEQQEEFKELQKKSQEQQEALENWMNLTDVPRNLPKATSSDVGAFIENGEIFGYLYDILPEPLQCAFSTTHRITSKVIRTVLRIVWAVVSIAFNIITNFIPYLLLSITTLSQSNELLTRGILLGVVKSDKKISDILQDRRKNEVPSRAKRVISQID